MVGVQIIITDSSGNAIEDAWDVGVLGIDADGYWLLEVGIIWDIEDAWGIDVDWGYRLLEVGIINGTELEDVFGFITSIDVGLFVSHRPLEFLVVPVGHSVVIEDETLTQNAFWLPFTISLEYGI